MTLTTEKPKIVSPEEWQAARAFHLEREKAHTRASDALAAERRNLPRMRVEKNYEFESVGGKTDLPGLFEGRSQLIVHHFMWESMGDPSVRCAGCSLLMDNIVHPAPLHARDVTVPLASPHAPIDGMEDYKERMGWDVPWYTTSKEFNLDHDVEIGFGINVFLREDGDILRTYFTGSRGAEPLGNLWTYLDRVPYGRQEAWEEAPEGTP